MSDMRIVVTGGTGFAGGWLAETLLAARRRRAILPEPPRRAAARVGRHGPAHDLASLRPVRPRRG